MPVTKITITHPETVAELSEYLGRQAGEPRRAMNDLARYLKAVASGVFTASIDVGMTAVQAYATATPASVVATDTLVVNGVTFTAAAKYATATVAFSTIVADNKVTISGQDFTAKVSATGAAEFALGANDAAALVNLAAKVNAHPVVGLLVQMSGATGVITAVTAGASGNNITIAKTGDPITISGDSGGKLSGAYVAANDEFPVESTDALQGAAIATAINAATDATVSGQVTASAASNGVVTITAVEYGPGGNNYTIAQTGDTITVAAFANGSNGSTVTTYSLT